MKMIDGLAFSGRVWFSKDRNARMVRGPVVVDIGRHSGIGLFATAG